MNKITVIALAAMMLAGGLSAQRPMRPKSDSTQAPRMMLKHNFKQDSNHTGIDKQGPVLRVNKERQRVGGQERRRQMMKSTDLRYNADGIETTIVKAFPEVKTVKKGEKWTEVYNKKDKLIGYVVYSKPASDGIRGYKGETPVLIAFDKKKIIRGVYMLPNMETPAYEKRLEDAGFCNLWNGLSVKKAKKKKVDTVSGATFTSRAVALSVQAALEQL